MDAATSACLLRGLYTSVPIFLGGVLNTIAISAVGFLRGSTILFTCWLLLEVALGVSRLGAVLHCRRLADRNSPFHVSLLILLSCAWSASVGFGACISILSQDWVLSTVACLSAAGMVCGICLRNHGTPRLVATMMILSLGPPAIAGALSSENTMLLVAVQLPVYVLAMSLGSFHLNRVLVGRMLAQTALEKSEAFNRSILEASPDYTILLNAGGYIVFCSTPQQGGLNPNQLIGSRWLDLLPPESVEEAVTVLAAAAKGEIGRMTIVHSDDASSRCFDLALTPLHDSSERMLIVARDVTEHKASENRAVWMAQHDALTELPNRLVVQGQLDELCGTRADGIENALLVLDVDNFKLINDTLGHDAGDALLCAFARRLEKAVAAKHLVARLGGDEFAILLINTSVAEVQKIADQIFTELHFPFHYEGKLLEANVSIGASFFPRDGSSRSDLFKAADLALYAAKSQGRGQLKVFSGELRNAYQSKSSTLSLARSALTFGGIEPFYQPKVSLITGEITGLEALLRWRNAAGELRRPDELRAALEDVSLAVQISSRMLDGIFQDVRAWLDAGVNFGDVALNTTAADFRDGRFADSLLDRLAREGVPPSCLQIEVTEDVFLGRGANHVERALRDLRHEGIKIALDDFGTGYASLSHLMQFPVDALKLDSSFVRDIESSSEARAISSAIVSLGRSLDLEVVAEGIESTAQVAHLLAVGCPTGQGYLFSKAIAREAVVNMLSPGGERHRMCHEPTRISESRAA